MTWKRIIVYGFLIFLAVGVFYYLPYFENICMLSVNKIDDLGLKILSEAGKVSQKEISAPPPLRGEKDSADAVLTRKGVIDFTNIERKKEGKNQFKENGQLNVAAEKKARDILAKQYFDHVNPDGNGPDFFVNLSDYEYLTIGENLALGGFANDQALVEAWMASPGHRENILKDGFQEIGVAVIKGVYEGKLAWVAVQEFGTPESACPAADEKIKSDIEASQKKIDSLSDVIKSKKSKIEDMSPRDAGYNQAIDKYNEFVNDYNSLVAKTKKMIEKYNSQVKDHNDCVNKL